MHLVSVVEGKLRRRLRPAGRAGGVLPGRHRVGRAEGPRDGDHRGARARRGAASTRARSGYLDFAGNLDFCIAIRTIVMAGGKAYVQAGAGIVADSNPAAEYEETCDKARARPAAARLEARRQAEPEARSDRRPDACSSSTTTTRSPTTSCSTSASSAPRCASCRNDEVTVDEIVAMQPDRIVISPGPGRPEDAGITHGARSGELGPSDADPRRVPRPPGDRRWRSAAVVRAPRADARQDLARSTTTAAACSPACRAVRRRALPLADGVADEGLPAELEVTATHGRGRR